MKECSFPPVGERCLFGIELCKRAKQWQICENDHDKNLKLNKERRTQSRQEEISCLDRRLLTDCFSYVMKENKVQ